MVAHALGGDAAPGLARHARPAGPRFGHAAARLRRATARCSATIGRRAPPTYLMRDPTDEPWYRTVARWLDNGFDAIVAAPSRPPLVDGREPARRLAGDRRGARRAGDAVTELRRAPEGTAFISAAMPLAGNARNAAAHRQRPRHPPPGARRALLARLRLARDAGAGDPALALPRPHHRRAAAPPRRRRAPGPARPRARGRRADACPSGATRSACSPARCTT